MKLSEETREALIHELIVERAQKAGEPVLVTTEHRGVFFGYADDISGSTITLTKARNCIYWHKSIGGFLGLASVGPNAQCKIGARAPRLTLHGVTSVSAVEPVAVEAWESAPCAS